MTINKPKLNDDKTEIILTGKDVHSIPVTTLNVKGNFIQTINCIKNLGVYLDNDKSMSSHIKIIQGK